MGTQSFYLRPGLDDDIARALDGADNACEYIRQALRAYIGQGCEQEELLVELRAVRKLLESGVQVERAKSGDRVEATGLDAMMERWKLVEKETDE